MRSPFRYPGGKTRAGIQRLILDQMPHGIQEYREPFVGGGGIFFALDPKRVKRRWINDKNQGLVSVYRAFVERPQEFIARCKSVPPAAVGDPQTEAGVRGGLAVNARLKDEFERVKLNEEEDQAYRYFFVNRTVFGGRVNYDLPSRLYFSNEKGWNIVEGNHLHRVAEHLQGARVTQGDYAILFEEDGEDVWIYADPPYYRDTELTKTSKLYQHSFSVDDHVRFAECVRNCKHKVCLSYDDCEFIRRLYSDPRRFHQVKHNWKYCGTTDKEKADGKELLILSYSPNPSMLFSTATPVLASLSDEEEKDLAFNESLIAKGDKSPFEQGQGLKNIRERRLYRGTDARFKDYCNRRWGMVSSYAQRLIDGFNIRKLLEKDAQGHTFPETERQARPLSLIRDVDNNIDHERVAIVWSDVVKRAEHECVPVTARMVREEVCKAQGLPPEHVRTRLSIRLFNQLKSAPKEEIQDFHRLVREQMPNFFALSQTGGE